MPANFQPRPRYDCDTCQDWQIVVADDGKGTLPCPTCRPEEHRTATTAR